MYALEFETRGTHNHCYIRFWKDEKLVRVYLAQYKLTPDPVPGFINLMSRLLSALSSKPRLVSASGCRSDLFECLDRVKYFSQGVQCPLRINVRSFSVILRQADGTVFGAIDFLSQLKYLIVFLGGCQDQPWAIKSPEFSSVSPFHFERKNWVWALQVYILIILSGCYFLQFGVEFHSSHLLRTSCPLEIYPGLHHQGCSFTSNARSTTQGKGPYLYNVWI